MMGFRLGLSLRPSLTGDILCFPTVRVPSRLPYPGFFVVIAMENSVSLVASCLSLAWIAFVHFVFRRPLLDVLVVRILGIVVLACALGIFLVRDSI